MAEVSFIKTVAFGGYDKDETEKMFEAMNQLICELQNEMMQKKLLIEKYESISDKVKNYEAALTEEKIKVRQLQSQNETLTAENKSLSSALHDKELEITRLKSAAVNNSSASDISSANSLSFDDPSDDLAMLLAMAEALNDN